MPNGISQLLNLPYSKTCLTADFQRFIAQYGWTTVSLGTVSYETCLTADFKSSPWQSASCLRAKCVCMSIFFCNKIVFMPDGRALLVLCVETMHIQWAGDSTRSATDIHWVRVPCI